MREVGDGERASQSGKLAVVQCTSVCTYEAVAVKFQALK